MINTFRFIYQDSDKSIVQRDIKGYYKAKEFEKVLTDSNIFFQVNIIN